MSRDWRLLISIAMMIGATLCAANARFWWSDYMLSVAKAGGDATSFDIADAQRSQIYAVVALFLICAAILLNLWSWWISKR